METEQRDRPGVDEGGTAPRETGKRASGRWRIVRVLLLILGLVVMLTPLWLYLFVVVAFWLDPPCFGCF